MVVSHSSICAVVLPEPRVGKQEHPLLHHGHLHEYCSICDIVVISTARVRGEGRDQIYRGYEMRAAVMLYGEVAHKWPSGIC